MRDRKLRTILLAALAFGAWPLACGGDDEGDGSGGKSGSGAKDAGSGGSFGSGSGGKSGSVGSGGSIGSGGAGVGGSLGAGGSGGSSGAAGAPGTGGAAGLGGTDGTGGIDGSAGAPGGTGGTGGGTGGTGGGTGGAGGGTGGTGGGTGGTGGGTGGAGGGTGGTGGGTGGTGGGTGGTGGGTGGTGGGTGGTGGGTGGTGGGTGGTGGGTGGTGGGTGGTGGGTGGTGGGTGGGSTLCDPAPPTGAVYYVATNGNNGNTGAANNEWATINYAITHVPDGATIIVRPGTYSGRVQLDTVFAQGIVIRSEQPYRALLRHTSTVVTSYYGKGITLEGFDIAHAGAGAGALVIQIQDLIGPSGGSDYVSRIVIRNNVLHDSYNNDILKINNGAGQITVESNVFYNQTGSDEHIDINSVTDVVVQDNVFFNDFAGSGRTNANDTSSYVVVKDSNGTDDSNLGSQRIRIRRNVFLNWEGSTGSNFVLLGEDGTANYEAQDVTVENNLMLGNSSNTMRAAFGVKGCDNVTFRHNTVTGNLPSLAFAMRLNREGSNLQNRAIRFYNNIWSDPSGTMDDFSDTPPADTQSFTLDNNLYYNGAQSVPIDAAELVNRDDDANAVLGNPQLGALTSITLPRWNAQAGNFGAGAATICEAFTRLVDLYCIPASNSAALNAADAANSPNHDIAGTTRPQGSAPDIGACERP